MKQRAGDNIAATQLVWVTSFSWSPASTTPRTKPVSVTAAVLGALIVPIQIVEERVRVGLNLGMQNGLEQGLEACLCWSIPFTITFLCRRFAQTSAQTANLILIVGALCVVVRPAQRLSTPVSRGYRLNLRCEPTNVVKKKVEQRTYQLNS